MFKLTSQLTKFPNQKQNTGYIALASMLIIMALVLTIGISASLISINDTQLSLASQKTEESFNETFGCAEDALLALNKNDNLPASIIMPHGTCNITLENQTGTSWTFVVSSSSTGYVRQLRVTADRTTNVDITSWEEI